jgi:hypothetical protein
MLRNITSLHLPATRQGLTLARIACFGAGPGSAMTSTCVFRFATGIPPGYRSYNSVFVVLADFLEGFDWILAEGVLGFL